MKKQRFTLEELEVQSFATTSTAGAQRGTVRAHGYPTDEIECPTGWAATCADTCAGTCQCEGNTGDCTVICYTDAVGSRYISRC
jgi:hypothetical protein